MSVLDRFEKSVEGAVNGVFAKFGSKDLKPVDLSSALEREIDKEAMPVTRDRTVAPNEYRFKLSTPVSTTSSSGAPKRSPMNLPTTSPSMRRARTTRSSARSW